jgi:hypothetical protein
MRDFPPQITNSKVTPLALSVLLHHHFRVEPHPNHEAPGVREIEGLLVALDVLTPTKVVGSYIVDEPNVQPGHNIYSTTPRGKAWVQALCRVTIPTKAEIPHGDQKH